MPVLMYAGIHPSLAYSPQRDPGQTKGAGEGSPVKIIFDTDMDSDCDDAGALAVLHALADRGECEILGVMVSSEHPYSPYVADAINIYYNRPDVPMGVVRKEGASKGSRYAKEIAGAFPHHIDYEELPGAALLYREMLEEQSDQSVVIVTVGYLTNISNLLKLPAREGRLSGKELVKKKVRKWVCMGGNFKGFPPVDELDKVNPNFQVDPDASHYAVNHWPVDLVFAGREVGSVPSGVRAGEVLTQTPPDNPVRRTYELFFGGKAKDRHVADLVTVLYAVRGERDYWDIQTEGYMDLQPDMKFKWELDKSDKDHGYLLKKKVNGEYNDPYIESVLDSLLIQEPGYSAPGNPD